MAGSLSLPGGTLSALLSALTKKHIPTITVKSNFTLPWFDSDCFEAYRDKQRAHKKFRVTKIIMINLNLNLSVVFLKIFVVRK